MTDLQVEPDEQERVAATEAAMVAAGVATHEPVPDDYFGFDETLRIDLPDGVSWVEHQILNEGQRRKYLNKVNRDVKFQKTTGDAIMRLSPGDEKAELLTVALCNWNLTRRGVTTPFNPGTLREFLDKASPRIIDLIEKEVKKANPWLLAELSIEDIDREIEALTEMRKTKEMEAEGKDASNAR